MRSTVRWNAYPKRTCGTKAVRFETNLIDSLPQTGTTNPITTVRFPKKNKGPKNRHSARHSRFVAPTALAANKKLVATVWSFVFDMFAPPRPPCCRARHSMAGLAMTALSAAAPPPCPRLLRELRAQSSPAGPRPHWSVSSDIRCMFFVRALPNSLDSMNAFVSVYFLFDVRRRGISHFALPRRNFTSLFQRVSEPNISETP